MLSARGEDGSTYREVLQGQLERARTDKRRQEMEEELLMPPFPEAVRYLWNAYWRIRARAGGGETGPQPIRWPDIDAFIRLAGLRFAPWEVRIIEVIDDAWLRLFQAEVDEAGG